MKIFVILALCCSYFSLAVSADPKTGLKCQTKSKFEYCEGTSAAYTAAASKVQTAPENSPLSIKVKADVAGGKVYGYLPKQRCDLLAREKCQQFNVIITPTYMKNSAGQPRYILQNFNGITQKIHLAICSDNKCGLGTCDQQYVTIQLLAWDPVLPYLVVDNFRIPSCCKCGHIKFPGR